MYIFDTRVADPGFFQLLDPDPGVANLSEIVHFRAFSDPDLSRIRNSESLTLQ